MYTYKTGLSTSEHDRFVIDSPQTNLLQSSSWAKIKDSWGNDRLGFYQDGNLVDLGKNRYVQIKENWYYVGNDGKILTGYHTIDGVDRKSVV